MALTTALGCSSDDSMHTVFYGAAPDCDGGASNCAVVDPIDSGLDVKADAPRDAPSADAAPGSACASFNDAGLDAGPRMLTPDDYACTTTADCTIHSCRGCCETFEVGVNKSSTFECAPVGCPAGTIGCPPEALLTQDCEIAVDGVRVACVNHQCRTLAIPSDAAPPADGDDGR
jgi:hypothetical protein